MNASQPPRLATWLLERCGVHESIVGDLVERYPANGASAWYWRQAVVAIVTAAARDIRDHKLLAARAVVVGLSALFVFEYLTWTFMTTLGGALWINGRWFQPQQVLVSIWYVWVSLGGAVSGWIVGCFHRSHRASMTFLFAGSFLTWHLLQLGAWLTIAPMPIWFTTGDFGLFTLTFAVSILLGGLWSARPTRRLA